MQLAKNGITMLDTLFIISLGELGTSLLEAVARSNLFRRIVVGSRSEIKAIRRMNNALIGAGMEDCYPQLEAVEFDFNDPASTSVLKSVNPDVIFSAPTLMPWWKISTPGSGAIPFGGYISLQLAPMRILQARIAEANLDSLWIAASFPDVINPVLAACGLAPFCGIGNVQEPIAKICSRVAAVHHVEPAAVSVRLVAQHAFEYFVMRDEGCNELPPYLLEVLIDGKDVTATAREVLKAPFPFPYDLHFNRVTASAGLNVLKAMSNSSPTATHLPGCLGLPGGYPVIIDGREIRLDLAPGWTRDEAIDVNRRSMRWDGIEQINTDGTVVFTQETSKALFNLTGEKISGVHPDTAIRQAHTLLEAL